MNDWTLPARVRAIRPENRKTPRDAGWYRIENHADTSTARVLLYADIGIWGITALDFVNELDQLHVDTIDLRINSGGGDLFDGFTIYSALKNHPARVVATVDGLAASAASFIAMAAEEVVMEKTGTMMIHDGMSPFCSGNAAALREMADLLDKMSDTIAGIYADRSGRAKDDFRALMQAETWFNADEAVAAGLADRVAGQDPEDDEEQIAARSDVASAFNFAGRDGAPAPVIPAPAAPVATAPPRPSLDVAALRNAIKEAVR